MYNDDRHDQVNRNIFYIREMHSCCENQQIAFTIHNIHAISHADYFIAMLNVYLFELSAIAIKNAPKSK